MTVVLDTNALIWTLDDQRELGRRSRREIEQALRDSRLTASAVSFWEVAMLVARKRLTLDRPVSRWRLDALRAGIAEVQLDGELAVDSVDLAGLHNDPMDRFIVATAIRTKATLITSDRTLLSWKGPLACIDARV
jgi:PIN domain nuclease of toxin-antitoxin system